MASAHTTVFLLLISYSALGFSDPVDLNITTFTNISTFTIESATNKLTFNNAGDSNPGLITPFQYNGLAETLICDLTYTGLSPFPIDAEYLIASAQGLAFQTENLRLTKNSSVVHIPTLGPCFNNGLKLHGEKIWSNLTFEHKQGGPDYTLYCSISREYQYALTSANITYWVHFGPGRDPYYTVIVPTTTATLGLKIDVVRVNASLPPPTHVFTVFALATLQKCLNPGIPDERLPGVVESYTPVPDTQNTFSHIFDTVLPDNSLIFIDIITQGTLPVPDYFHGYTITLSLPEIVPSPPTPPPPPMNDSTGTTIAIVCVFLVVLIAGALAYYFCVVKKKQTYQSLQPQ